MSAGLQLLRTLPLEFPFLEYDNASLYDIIGDSPSPNAFLVWLDFNPDGSIVFTNVGTGLGQYANGPSKFVRLGGQNWCNALEIQVGVVANNSDVVRSVTFAGVNMPSAGGSTPWYTLDTTRRITGFVAGGAGSISLSFGGTVRIRNRFGLPLVGGGGTQINRDIGINLDKNT